MICPSLRKMKVKHKDGKALLQANHGLRREKGTEKSITDNIWSLSVFALFSK